MKIHLSVLVIMFGMLAGIARADGLNIVNGDFQQAGPMIYTCLAPANCTWNGGPIPGWSSNDPANEYGSQISGNAMYTSLPGGPITVWLNGGSIFQTLDVGLTPDTTYTFSIYVGHRLPDTTPLVPGDPGADLIANYSISLTAGGDTLATLTGSNGDITAGTFALETLTYTTGNTVGPGDLGIVLGSSGAQIDFADDALESTSTPEPGSLALFGSGLLGIAGIARRKFVNG
jgi:PEP-CTERM motif